MVAGMSVVQHMLLLLQAWLCPHDLWRDWQLHGVLVRSSRARGTAGRRVRAGERRHRVVLPERVLPQAGLHWIHSSYRWGLHHRILRAGRAPQILAARGSDLVGFASSASHTHQLTTCALGGATIISIGLS